MRNINIVICRHPKNDSMAKSDKNTEFQASKIGHERVELRYPNCAIDGRSDFWDFQGQNKKHTSFSVYFVKKRYFKNYNDIVCIFPQSVVDFCTEDFLS